MLSHCDLIIQIQLIDTHRWIVHRRRDFGQMQINGFCRILIPDTLVCPPARLIGRMREIPVIARVLSGVFTFDPVGASVCLDLCVKMALMTVGNTAGVQAALRLQGVELRRYGRTILTEVDLEVPRGGKWVLFGPNGIGKSSLVQMMATRAFPSRGTVDVLGRRLGKTNVFSYRHLIGLSSAELARAFPPGEDPLDAVVTSLTATTGRWRDQYTEDEYAQARALMRRFGIDYLEGKAMRALSEGERTRVMLCRACLGLKR